MKLILYFQFLMHMITIFIFIDVFSLGKIYGISDIFNQGYGRFRSFGIAGQPGVQGFYNVLFIVLNIALLYYKKISIKMFILLSFIGLIATFLTGSRIALALYILLIFIPSIFNAKIFVFYFFSFIFLFFYYS